jgi:mannose-6-phosphate isomerase
MLNQYLKAPLKATGERVWRTYIGGKKLDEISGRSTCEDNHFPEQWILSTIRATNNFRKEIVEGICYVKVGETELSLVEIISRYPSEMLGNAYNERFSGSMGVLVKIIDAKERLTIQVHPTKEKARKFFDSEYGKTECWYIIDTRQEEVEEPCVYIGFKEGVTKELFLECFVEQNLEKMLSLLHCIKVQKGDTYIIPGGVPHAIGAGCLLIEIQEPTDYTLRVEKTTPLGYQIDDLTCHLGIGIENMMDCFSFEDQRLDEILETCKLAENKKFVNGNEFISLVDYVNTPCFKMEKIIITNSITFNSDSCFYGLYILCGHGKLITAMGETPVSQNDQYYIATTCEDFKIEVQGEAIEMIRFWGQQLS